MTRPVPTITGSRTTVTLLVVLLTSGFALIACGNDQPIDAGDETLPADDSGGAGSRETMPSLAGTWVLERLEMDGQEVPLPSKEDGDAMAPTMTIELGEIRGESGCNSFSGSLTIDEDGSASINDLANTEMACMGEGLMDFEQVYLSALRAVTGWEADPDGIALIGDGGRVEYGPGPVVEPAALFDTTWVLDSLYAGEGADRAVSSTDQSAPEATLVVSEDSAEISAPDCSPFIVAIAVEQGGQGGQGAFSVDADELTTAADGCTNPNVASMVEGLGASFSYLIDDQRLVFVGFEGETIGFTAS